MNAPVSLGDLLLALDFESDDVRCLFDRQTGRIVMVESSTLDAMEPEDDAELAALPDW